MEEQPQKVDRRAYRRKNNRRRFVNRLKHPWPIYKRKSAGGINAVVIHADGTETDLGRIADTYTKRWGVGSR